MKNEHKDMNDMKQQYVKPAMKARSIEAEPLMLVISGGEPEDELVGNAKGRRGQWGNLWNEPEE